MATSIPLPDPGPEFLSHILDLAPVWALGSEQRELRLSLVQAMLGQAANRPDCLAAAQSLLGLAFQEEPWAPAVLTLAQAVQSAQPFLPGKATALLRLLAAAVVQTPDDVRVEDIQASGDAELAIRYLEIAAKDRQLGLARLLPAFAFLCRLPEADQAMALLTGFAPVVPPLLFSRLRAELAFLRQTPDKALAVVEALDQEVWGLYAALATSRLAERFGDRDRALAACLTARRHVPFHVNLTLRASDLAFPAPEPADPGTEAAVCLYSLNKADLLHECLTHLAQTRLGGSLVAVVDNGSTDQTPSVIAAAAKHFPADRFVSVRLPVNVGAPGARNWLLALPEVKARPYVAFVDDDAFPQTDWLARLLATAARHPRAGVVGCAIVDRCAPGDHQSADYNLFPPAMGQPSLPEVTERLFVCDACRLLPDYGLFAYTRPCLSVSGCCHLLSRAAIEAAGPFDIRFNPTQFDDLDRDIRSWLAGYPAVYDGSVRVAHEQASSLAKAKTPAQVAHILGNKIKLETKFTDEDVERLWRENLDVLKRDLLDKDAALRSGPVAEEE